MNARELMTKDPATLTPADTVRRAAELMRDHDVGLIPVVDDRRSPRLLGVITDRDIALRCVADGHDGDTAIQEVMSAGDIARVEPEDDVESIERQMRERQVRRIPVVTDGGRLVGIVAQADIATRTSDAQAVARTVETISQPVNGARA